MLSLTDLLNSNYAPAEHEIDRIQDICSQSAGEMDRMNTQIARLQASLDSITAKRDELQRKLDTYRVALSPLRRCPTEILQQIFVWTMQSFPVISSSEAPLLLGRVCNRWRAISTSTPELWSAIHVVVPEALYSFDPFDEKCERIRQGLNTWLGRARQCPLHISVFSRNENTYQQDIIEVARTLKLLVPYSRQWKYLSLRVPASTLSAFSDVRGEDVPLLETALIACSDPNPFILENSSRHPTFLADAPSLQYLSLGDAGPLFRPIVPWHQLRFLSLDHNDWNFGAHDLMQILAECWQLKECQLMIHARTDISHPENDDPISLLSLEKFSLNTNSSVMVEVLDQLHVPSLQHLHLDGYRAELNAPVVASLKGLLHRSRYPLQSLKLEIKRSPDLNTSALIDLLKTMPSLQALVFAEGNTQVPVVDEELLVALADTSEVICPLLEVMHFPDRFTFTADALEKFLLARLEPSHAEISCLKLALIVSYRRNLAQRFTRFGERVKIIEDIPYRSMPSIGRPSSRYLEYSDQL